MEAKMVLQYGFPELLKKGSEGRDSHWTCFQKRNDMLSLLSSKSISCEDRRGEGLQVWSQLGRRCLGSELKWVTSVRDMEVRILCRWKMTFHLFPPLCCPWQEVNGGD